jgi:hypothetical protein
MPDIDAYIIPPLPETALGNVMDILIKVTANVVPDD